MFSLAAFDALFQAERDAEGAAEWRGMYWGDRHRFTNFQARRREVLGLKSALQKSKYRPASQIDCKPCVILFLLLLLLLLCVGGGKLLLFWARSRHSLAVRHNSSP